MGTFKVKTDREFFGKFDLLSEQVKGLKYFFQNDRVDATDEEILEWEDDFEKVEESLSELYREAITDRIRRK